MTLINLFRILRRDPVSLITNITGLSLGLAASILLSAFILFELSFDRYFSKADRIYRLNSVWIEKGEGDEMPINIREAYTEIPENVAGIEAATQIYRGSTREISYENNRYKDLKLLYADPEFFRIFDLDFLEGIPERALNEPYTVVITEEVAGRIYGKTDVVGLSFTMENQLYTISAVVLDIPPNTHFDFDMLMPMQSVPNLENLGGLEFFTYYLLEMNVDPGPVLQNIARENTSLLTSNFAGFGSASFNSRLTPLTSIHLHSGISWDLTPPGNIRTIYIMLVITIAVMLLALSNFINLYILNGAKRSREIGIRKVNGAGRRGLIRQFYLETILVVTISYIAGVVLTLVLIHPFANIMQRDAFSRVGDTPTLYLVLAAIYLLTILLSGFYPALLLSKFSPVPLLHGAVNPAGDKRILLRTVSVLQICITVSLLSILLGINAQIRYLKNRSVGYNPENIVLIYNLNQKLVNNFDALRDQLLGIPGIEEVAASSHTIGQGSSGQGILMYGDDPEHARSIAEYRIRPGLCHLYQFNLLAGRFLDPERPADNQGVILNEKAVKMLGSNPQEIVGQSVDMHGEPLEVIGVVEDFHFESAASEVDPLVLTAYSEDFRNISVRYRPGSDPQKILQSVTNAFREIDPDYIMVNRFAIDICQNYYTREERLQKIVFSGSLFSIIIVLLGIYALVSHNMVARTKEIGVRKVMGGSTSDMMILIYTSTLKWTVIGSVLAIPLSYFYLKSWLNDYAVRIPLYWWIFLCSILVVVIFQTLLTLGQTWRTARRNPVEALRYE